VNAEPSVMTLAEEIFRRPVPRGSVLAWWLGGAGFVFKTSGGTEIYVDPYLSDRVRDIFGIARAFPTPIRPEEARPDLVVATHWHEDHLDPGAIPVISQGSPRTRFLMPPSAMARALSWGLARDRITPMSPGQSFDLEGIRISHAPARHDAGVPGWEVPDAMGIVIEAEGLKIYHSGDTEYDTQLRRLRSQRFDVALLCMNGVGGNMNVYEAALLAKQLEARTVIPMHHYLWAERQGGDEETLDARVFQETYLRLGGAGQVVLPRVAGEMELRGGAR
jgi:L-ascorbate 6-phosphate lactonase